MILLENYKPRCNVFSHTLEEEKNHDFSKSSIFEYKHFITRIFYHLHDEKQLVAAIFLSQSKDVFSEYLRESIRPLALRCVESNFVPEQDFPKDIKINSLIENFLVIIRYCIDTDYK